ncbi:hypothetical protein CFP71_14630 [Amycolatopsis thailandensis]|uniref:Uncharacterized protein n=1 Tax=Amycolatopsis thailandensis TaxID=589330 RepID=A0A229SAX6_9PSEU|nr:hypothetical protein CFP71_14630 [Amycolatopsis thailandensis]
MEGQRSVAYGCEFSRVDDGSGVGSLMVTAIKGEAAPESALAVAEQNCLGEGQAQPLAGAGEAAMWCRSEDLDTLVVTVKRSHGEVRIAHLTLACSPMAANHPRVRLAGAASRRQAVASEVERAIRSLIGPEHGMALNCLPARPRDAMVSMGITCPRQHKDRSTDTDMP